MPFESIGGRGIEDKAGCIGIALPGAVGSASMGAMLGIEMTRSRNQDKIGDNYITSEIYSDDFDGNFHVDSGDFSITGD